MASEVPVSVVVPTRNRAASLPACLATLAAQACDAPFEVVVVDNASTDETAAVIQTTAEADPRFIPARATRPGRSAALNAGIATARGRLLLFTDDDVLVDPGWIGAFWDLFASRTGEAFIAGGAIVPVVQDLGAWPRWLTVEARTDLGTLHWGGQRPLAAWEYLWGANMAVPREVFDRHGLWDESLGRRGDEVGTYEDIEFQDRVRAAGGVVWFTPRAIVQHRIARRGISPRRVLRTAFARGRNDYTRPTLRDTAAAPPAAPSGAPGLLLLGWRIWTWALWALLFRLAPIRPIFDRAHRSAWATGWTLQHLLSAERTAWLARRGEDGLRPGVLWRVVTAMHRLAVHLAPTAGK